MIDTGVDRLARASADQLRAGTTGDVEAGLADLHVRQARRRRRTGVAAAAAVVLAAALGLGSGVVLTHSQADREPAPPTNPGTRTDDHLADPVCVTPRVTCLGDRTYEYGLVRPVVWAVPPGFGGNSASGATSMLVEIFRSAGPPGGVSILERARASTPDGARPAPGVADSPRAFVDWVASRPFLRAGRVHPTTVDGRAAWSVRVTLMPNAPQGRFTCPSGTGATTPCHAIAHQADGAASGIWGDMAAEYTALRLPGGGTTVVWTWIFTGNPAHLGALEEAVHGISWPDV
jgi:hypothetical protein